MVKEINEVPGIDEAFYRCFCNSGKTKIATASTKEERKAVIDGIMAAREKKKQ